jgi:SAM-dependent methyltransferase
MGSLSFDPIAERYDATRGGEGRGRFVANVLRPWLPGGGVVCEIGVGTALVAAAVAAGGPTVVGIDISAAMLAVGALAAVYGVWVFHVVDDPGAVLASCRRALRPGGRVLAIIGDESRRVGHPLLDELERRYRVRSDAIEQLEPLAAGAGLRRRHVEPLAPFRRPTAPAELAHHLEQRTWSWLWAVPPDAWAADVEPVIAALRAEPDPDQPRPRQNANVLVVWNRP